MSDARRSFLGSDRGQTLQDYVVGISVFLVVVFLALGFFPDLLSGFQSETVGDHEAQADRVGRQLVSNASMNGTVNELDADVLDEIMGLDESSLRDRYGLDGAVNVNITLQSLDGRSFVTDAAGNPVTSTPRYFGDAAGSAARIVTVSDSDYDCSPACRLVVRAW